MRLSTRSWGPRGANETVVCLHGVGQHGGIFEALAQRLIVRGLRVVALDLRGHGDSGREPPWDIDQHVLDLMETAASLEIESANWLGHSFGGLLSAAVAAADPKMVDRLVLLDPGIEVDPAYALKSAEMDRLDWSFATPEGAVNALLSSDTVIAAPRAVVTDYVAGDLQQGSDGRYRFRHSPGAAVVAWSESAKPAPPVARVPTLLVRPVTSAVHSRQQDSRYRSELGPMLSMAAVPHGHNVLWESPEETCSHVSKFLGNTGAPAPTG